MKILDRKRLLLCALFLLAVVSSCKKEPVGGDITGNPVDSTQNPPPDTSSQQWNLPWPKWIFYHWVWEDEGTQQSAMQLVDDYLAHDIPVGAIIIDSPWETGYNTFDWDPSLYPDPQAMVDYFHGKNIKVLVWITGVINTDVDSLYNYAAGNDWFMKQLPFGNPAVINWWKGDGSLIDWYNPDAVAWWKRLMDKVLDLGIDGWKVDGTDFYVLQALYSPYENRYVDRLDYSHRYYRLFHDYTREVLGDNRVNTARPIDNYGIADVGGDQVAFAPVDINWAGWVGDQDATFDGLQAALNNMYHSSEYGYLAFGSDIGGYRTDNNYPQGRSKTLFIRWTQLGAFCPVMENGGGGEHRPWMFDEQTTRIYRRFVKLHHCLVPYLMDNSAVAFSNGESLMQFFNKTDYAYMLGPDLFIQPLITPDSTITVNFPSGSDWIYIFDESRQYTGGQSQVLSFPLNEYPAFYREGSPLIDQIEASSL